MDGDDGVSVPRRHRGPDLRAGVDPRLEVVAAMGLDPGTAFELAEGAMMGRADGSDIPIDDPFASSVHACEADYRYGLQEQLFHLAAAVGEGVEADADLVE